jgi:hypothetical protein
VRVGNNVTTTTTTTTNDNVTTDTRGDAPVAMVCSNQYCSNRNHSIHVLLGRVSAGDTIGHISIHPGHFRYMVVMLDAI